MSERSRSNFGTLEIVLTQITFAAKCTRVLGAALARAMRVGVAVSVTLAVVDHRPTIRSDFADNVADILTLSWCRRV